MLSIITSFLLQSGELRLPYIGVFSTAYISAKNGIYNKQILSPRKEVVFKEEAILLSEELIKYISFKKNIAGYLAAIRLDNFCKEWKEKIDAGAKLCFEEVGCLQKNESGNIIFQEKEGELYAFAVPAKVVPHENIVPTNAAGDGAVSPEIVNGYFNEELIIRKRPWFIGALVLFLAALIVLIYSFYDQKWTPSSVGNRINFTIKPIEETHSEFSR